jgi:hypothetical protein
MSNNRYKYTHGTEYLIFTYFNAEAAIFLYETTITWATFLSLQTLQKASAIRRQNILLNQHVNPNR